jgi:hypothetical protein
MIRVVILDPDPDFLPISEPGSRGQKGTGSRIRIRNNAFFFKFHLKPCRPDVYKREAVPRLCHQVKHVPHMAPASQGVHADWEGGLHGTQEALRQRDARCQGEASLFSSLTGASGCESSAKRRQYKIKSTNPHSV